MTQKCLYATFSYVTLICQTYLHSLQIFPSKTEMFCFQVGQRVSAPEPFYAGMSRDSATSSGDELDFTCVDLD